MMMKGMNPHVIPLENGWGVLCGEGRNPNNLIVQFDTQEEALDYARRFACQQESDVLLHSQPPRELLLEE